MSNEVMNPFGDMPQSIAPQIQSAAAQSDAERAIKEVEAAMVIAKRFPRDPVVAVDKILQACTRTTLAESALYAYPRGGQTVTGPSIRLAEAIAQNWGNIQFGIRELSQANGVSTVEAFAWDIETNTRQTKVFQVSHIRYTRRGKTKLEDPRDVYETVANQGARRLRSCILGVIPGDVVEAAVRQCEVTVKNSADVSPEHIEKMVESFEEIGVTREMLVKRLGHHLDAVIAAEVLQLKKIYASIRDGFASVGDFFYVDEHKVEEKKTGVDALKDAVNNNSPG